jgi:endonuclease/exonuclease/phosphatase family metal-dependent hydrolase
MNSYSAQLWVRTTCRSNDFPAISANKAWDGGDIVDFTSHHNFGQSRNTGSLRGWCIALQPSGAWTWNVGDGEHRLDYLPTVQRQPINDGEWHHLAFSIDPVGRVAWLYYDGCNVAVYSLAELGDLLSGAPARSGAEAGDASTSFAGEIDDLKVEKRLLTPSEVESAFRLRRGGTMAHTAQEDAVSELRVLSWNIWHGGRRDDEGLARTIEIIRRSKADVICMQETYGSGAHIADALGYYFYLRSSNLSVMSRFPIRQTHDLFEPFRFGGVTLALSPAQEMLFFSLWIHYLPDFCNDVLVEGMTAEKLIAAEGETRGREIDQILEVLKPTLSAMNLPVVVAGDFNSPSHLDWTEAMRHRNRGLTVLWPVSEAMAKAGFTDSYRAVHPDPSQHYGRTWSPRSGADSWQDRIDYVYYRGDGLSCLSAAVLEHFEPRWPSDHAAVLVTLRLSS